MTRCSGVQFMMYQHMEPVCLWWQNLHVWTAVAASYPDDVKVFTSSLLCTVADCKPSWRPRVQNITPTCLYLLSLSNRDSSQKTNNMELNIHSFFLFLKRTCRNIHSSFPFNVSLHQNMWAGFYRLAAAFRRSRYKSYLIYSCILVSSVSFKHFLCQCEAVSFCVLMQTSCYWSASVFLHLQPCDRRSVRPQLWKCSEQQLVADFKRTLGEGLAGTQSSSHHTTLELMEMTASTKMDAGSRDAEMLSSSQRHLSNQTQETPAAKEDGWILLTLFVSSWNWVCSSHWQLSQSRRASLGSVFNVLFRWHCS